MENKKENIKEIFKETKEYTKNEFIQGVEKYFKKIDKYNRNNFPGSIIKNP